MKKLLITHATLISVDPDRRQIEKDTDILIEDGKITEIGSDIVSKNAKKINAEGKIVIPGLINTHTHASMSLFKETCDGLKLQDWLNDFIYPIEDKMKDEDFYNFALLNFIESLKAGVTTINDMYFNTKHIVKAKKKALIDGVTTVTLMDIDGSDKGQQRIDNYLEFIKQFPDEKTSISIHGLYTASPEYLKKVVKLSEKINNNLFHIHFCENSQEVLDINKKHNVKNPSEALVKYFKGIKPKLILAHCVKLSQVDVLNLKKLNASIAHCPVSNAKLGCGIADLKTISANGINITLGTDGEGSGCNASILDAAKLACLLPKAVNEDPMLFSAYEGLQMATINGARALGLEDSKGTVSVGKDADIVIVNPKSAQLFPVNHLIADIINNATAHDIETVIVNGHIAIKKGKHTQVNKKKLYKKCSKSIEKLFKTN
ncbi:MAG: amidohydrolase [Mycoplasmataceae bacterium]|jgi:5-methylthioadenosine/S-adenosylhomocysteine deaminase|nr:amidohydrolase [Mycoplasmataceae bacterium]